jgi:exopolysaccharide biosynthesis operon protein EpsL
MLRQSIGLTRTFVLLCLAIPAWGQDASSLTLNAGYSIATDSNLFRLPEASNFSALLGKSNAAETIQTSSVGINYNTAHSLQQLEFSLKLVDNKYQNFSHLNFTALDSDAAWRWAFTPRLRGNISSSRKETLNSFADLQGINVRNQRTDTRTRLDATYELTGPWQIIGGTSHTRQANEQTVASDSDYSTTSADIGLRYTFSSGSSLTCTTTTASGAYLNRALSAAGFYDDSFSQIDNELRLHWAVTGNSTANLRLTHINRSHPHFDQRDYNGLNSALDLNWSLTGKTALTAAWTRELASYQTNDYNYSQTNRLMVGPVWQVGAKLILRMRHEIAQRSFLGTPTGIIGPLREDTTQETSLSAQWQPYKFFTLVTSLQNVNRSSSLPDLDYVSNIATISSQFSF